MDKIKLLDGKEYIKKTLIGRMYNDEFYYGELNKLALSSSSLNCYWIAQRSITI